MSMSVRNAGKMGFELSHMERFEKALGSIAAKVGIREMTEFEPGDIARVRMRR